MHQIIPTWLVRNNLIPLTRIWLVLGIITLSASAKAQSIAESGEPDFATEVRPILSDKCLKCHGPDKAHRATDLRLDDQASVHSIAINAQKPADSDLIHRIDSEDPADKMPPPDSKMQLSQQEREVLRRWVMSGAKFAKHWSFESLKPVDLPALPEDSIWRHSKSPIDKLVGRRLKELDLKPSRKPMQKLW